MVTRSEDHSVRKSEARADGTALVLQGALWSPVRGTNVGRSEYDTTNVGTSVTEYSVTTKPCHYRLVYELYGSGRYFIYVPTPPVVY